MVSSAEPPAIRMSAEGERHSITPAPTRTSPVATPRSHSSERVVGPDVDSGVHRVAVTVAMSSAYQTGGAAQSPCGRRRGNTHGRLRVVRDDCRGTTGDLDDPVERAWGRAPLRAVHPRQRPQDRGQPPDRLVVSL